MKSTRKQQQGASFFSILLVLIVGGVFFSVGFKLYPAYTENMTINSILTDVISNPDELAKGKRGIQRDITKKLRINQVKLPSKDALKITEDKGFIRFNLKYEVRIPMFYNVDAMVKFEKQYEARLVD